jgi:hypothetical protein
MPKFRPISGFSEKEKMPGPNLQYHWQELNLQDTGITGAVAVITKTVQKITGQF